MGDRLEGVQALVIADTSINTAALDGQEEVMKIFSPQQFLLGSLLFFAIPINCALDQAPKLTVVLVIDQCAYHYFPKLKNNFRYGFKELLEKGIVYTKAIHPHGIPETTTGHHCISAGCYPKDHGGVTNQWIDYNGEKIHFEADNNPDAAIIPQDKKGGGKSSRNTMVDNLSDQFLQFTSQQNPAKVFALSMKSYPAISMAGKMGKALWFDENRGIFISSKMYFEALPPWVDAFNKKTRPSFATYQWKPAFDLRAPEYNYPLIRNYEFAGAPESYLNQFPLKINPKGEPRYFVLVRTPFANSMLLDLAKECINQNLDLQTDERMLLWVSLSQLDLLTHLFGPDNIEPIDTLYQLDRQIADFMTFLQRKVGASNCLLVLTADHGIAPIPEIQQKKGFPSAKRIMANQLIKDMNNEVERTLGIVDIVKTFEPNSFRLNYAIFSSLPQAKKTAVLDVLVAFLKHYPGIKNAWTYQELATKNVRLRQFAGFYKTQLFSGRIGDIICLPAPYCQITHYPTGTSHQTPYNYDTHVPLILYQPNKIRPQIIRQQVLMPQLPVTLAKLLHISEPSASDFEALPGF